MLKSSACPSVSPATKSSLTLKLAFYKVIYSPEAQLDDISFSPQGSYSGKKETEQSTPSSRVPHRVTGARTRDRSASLNSPRASIGPSLYEGPWPTSGDKPPHFAGCGSQEADCRDGVDQSRSRLFYQVEPQATGGSVSEERIAQSG